VWENVEVNLPLLGVVADGVSDAQLLWTRVDQHKRRVIRLRQLLLHLMPPELTHDLGFELLQVHGHDVYVLEELAMLASRTCSTARALRRQRRMGRPKPAPLQQNIG
jgi:hypothetical protein